MKKLRVSTPLNLHAYPREDMAQFIKQGLLFNKKAGFEATDFNVGMLDLTKDGWQGIVEQAVIDANEIGVPLAIGHLPFIGKGGTKDSEVLRAFSEKMFRAIDAAKLSGIEYAVMHPNAANFPLVKYDHDEQRNTTLELLSPFVEHANRVGLDVVVENMRVQSGKMQCHRYCMTAEELCDLADTLGIGICWDFGHAHLSGLKQSKALALVGDRLKVVHVNDNGGIEDDHVLPFSGQVDWKDAMHGLALTGFDGPFNFELAVRAPAELRRSYAAFMVDIANQLMSYIE